MPDQENLPTLLLHWSKAEPVRCRQNEDGSFRVMYLGEWLRVTSDPASHGTIIAAVLGGCQENLIYCEIEFTPRYQDYPNTLEIGCIHKMFRYREGEDVISSVPVLLLTEYLERLEKRMPAWVEELKSKN